MALAKKVRQFLKEHQVPYHTLRCPVYYSAQQLAHAKHISGYDVAKAVVLKSGSTFEVAVLPACCKVDFTKLKKLTGQTDIQLATEAEIAHIFTDSELGAIGVFGNVYGIPVYVDASLARAEEIVFSAGSHETAVRMKYDDFIQWVKPTVGPLATLAN